MKKWIVLIVLVVVLSCCGLGSWFLAATATNRVQRITEASPELQAAVKRAKDELPGFLKQLRAPKPGQRFAVRGRFMTANGPEFLWVREPRLDKETLVGILDERPIALQTLKKGDEAKVKLADVADWLILDPDGTVHGRYTEEVLNGGR